MIASMTGYGKSSIANEKIKLTVEIKSINSKQLDLIFRIPAIYRELETLLRNKLSNLLERGKVEVSIQYEKITENNAAVINTELVKAYKEEIDKLIQLLNLPEPKEYVQLLLRMPEALTMHAVESSEEENEFLLATTMEAAANLQQSRIIEGRGLYEFFFEKLARISEYLGYTERYENERIVRIRERLEQQLTRLQSVDIDRGRLEQEMIFYIEKLDVTEEKQRLKSHINYFEETLGGPNETEVTGKGKKLGFIAQEMGREINTLGSKANDAEMQKLVVMMKDELEQIKEQVLNVL